MITNRLQGLFLIAVAAVCSLSVSAQETSVTTPAADTWVGSGITARGTSNTVEIRTSAADGKNFYGLMTFSFTKPNSGYRVKSASLRLTTRYKKGDSATSIYPFKGSFTENSVFKDVSADITTALSAAPLAQFRLNSCLACAPTDAGVTDDFVTVDKWQVTVDLTAYARSAAGGTFSILIAKDMDQANSSQIYTREATDVTNTTKGFTFAAADLVPQLTVEYEVDANQYTSTTTTVADTHLRVKAPARNYGSSGTMEVYTYTNPDDPAKNQNFMGLLAFDIPAEALTADYTVQSATLRLVTERQKGNNSMALYAYDNNFDESTATYDTESSYITTALGTAPVATFKAAGEWSKSIVYDAVSDASATVSAWTNEIDLTDYVRTLTAPRFNLLLAATENGNTQKLFFTKEAQTFSNAKNPAITFTAADIIPQLTVVYTKNTSTGISDLRQPTAPAREGIYTLQGVRVSTVDKAGVYIINGRKVVVRK